jgi:23S rRNA A2030 N6-methylase RlmJ
MIYDHRKKAGNPGDIVKHIALLAALNGVLARSDKNPFRYADIFAGFPENPLIPDNEWEAGIGRLDRPLKNIRNPHIANWYNRYAGDKNRANGLYPGSAAIAADEIKRHGKQPELRLWDIADEVIEALTAYFGSSAAIFQKMAAPKDPLLRQADFIFIDPPGTASPRHPEFPEMEYLGSFFAKLDSNMLMWLPLENKGESWISKAASDSNHGMPSLAETTIKWSPEAGCRIIYRLPTSAIQALHQTLADATEEILPPITGFARMTNDQFSLDIHNGSC